MLALKSVGERISGAQLKFPKRGSYWNKTKKEFKKLPSLEVMARQARAKNIYQTEFRYGSLYVHASDRIFHRWVERTPDEFLFHVEPIAEEKVPSGGTLLYLYLAAVRIAANCGLAIDKDVLVKISRSAKGQGIS